MAYNILLVDDSSIIRKVIRKTFELTDVKIGDVFEANNGQEGLDILKNNWVDLVFLDINMPIMNGVEMTEAVRKDENLKNTPIVIVSTEGSQERKHRLAELGVETYLRKPATPEDLVAVVQKYLGAKQ